jgi:N-acetylmuramic acid 6-phosphate etherase
LVAADAPREEGKGRMSERATEAIHPDAVGLPTADAPRILDVLLGCQRGAVNSVVTALPAIAEAAELMATCIATERRLIYVGAGSSGLMALADALELPATFGIPPSLVRAVIPGGGSPALRIDGAMDDDADSARADIAGVELAPGDVVICVSASGSTPYTVAAAEAVRESGAALVGIANVPASPLLSLARVPVLLDTGPEPVAGSTRLGAATAQKVALNLMSTLMGIKLGHVHDGMMVNVVVENAKLLSRALRIVRRISGCGEEEARMALDASGGSVKPAVILAMSDMTAEQAEDLLRRHGGHLGPAIAGVRRT